MATWGHKSLLLFGFCASQHWKYLKIPLECGHFLFPVSLVKENSSIWDIIAFP